MDVNQAETSSVQIFLFDEVQHFVVFRERSGGQRIQVTQNLAAILEIPTSQFTHHEWMTQNIFLVQ